MALLMTLTAPIYTFADELNKGNEKGDKSVRVEEKKAEREEKKAEAEEKKAEKQTEADEKKAEKQAETQEKKAEKQAQAEEKKEEKEAMRVEKVNERIAKFEEKSKIDDREESIESEIEDLEEVLSKLKNFLGEEIVEELEQEEDDDETESADEEDDSDENDSEAENDDENENDDSDESEEAPAITSAKELFKQYKAEAKAAKDELKILKSTSKNLRKEIREIIKAEYSEEEILELNKLVDELEAEYDDIKILGVDSILSNGAQFKFDVPPVIKGGRILIPVNAITKGFGAEVSWDNEERKVTISKDDTVIEIWVDTNKAKIGDEEIELDSNAEVINGRTVVPLGFVAQALGLEVEWNEEDETIELNDPDDDEDEDSTDSDDSEDDTDE